MSKLLKYITDVSKMKPMTTEKVMKLSEKEFKYFPPNPQRATIPSVFVNVVFENISKVPKKDISVVLSLCAVLGKKFYDVPKSRDVFYSKIRKPILEKYGYGSPEYEKTLDLMKITKDERTKLKKDYGKKIKKENKERKTYYSEDLIGVIEETKDNADWATQAVGLMLASGCRTVELLDKNTFTADPKQKQWVTVSDIAKKREGKKDFTTSRPIIGYTGKEFVDAVTGLRNKLSGKQLYIKTGADAGQLNKSYSRLINVRLEKYFPNDPEITPKTLRKLYGNLAHALYGGSSNLNVFLSEVLGHDPEDLQTSFSYSTVRVIIGNKQSNTDNGNSGSNPELEVKTESLQAQTNILKSEIQKINEKVNSISSNTPETSEKRENTTRNMTDDKKVEMVKKTIAKMVKDGKKISQESVGRESKIGWRTVRPVLAEWNKNNK